MCTYIYIHIYIAASWRSVAIDLKTHPHCEDALGEDALEGADALGGADAL